MTLTEALVAIRAGRQARDFEASRLEFKQEGTTLKETGKLLSEAVICFANGSGGIIALGVSDDLIGQEAFLGTEIKPDTARRLIHERTRPPLTVEARLENHFGASLLIITVPEGLEIHADTQGRAYRRIDRECLAMTPTEQARLREERQGFDWSAQPSDRSIRDISAVAFESARRRLALLPDARREIARASDDDLLRSLGLIDSQGRLRRAGEVMLCDPRPGSPSSILYQYRSTPGGEPSAVERLSGPLIIAFLRALELVDARRNMTPITLPDGQQLGIQDFPDLAVREAVANAVIHRDYQLVGHVSIDHSRSALVVQSPGALVAGVTPENILTHPSKPRNMALTGAFRILGLAEETGRGVDRIYREMIRAGGGIPRIEDGGDGVRVALLSGPQNTRMARFVSRLPEDEREDTDTMLVLFTLCSRQSVAAPALTPLLQKSQEEIEAVLRRLASDPPAMLEATRGTFRKRHPSYRLRAETLQALGPAVRYQRRTVDDIDRKVISHVREYGKITNRTIRNLFDVEIHPAKDIIKGLVDRDVLVKVSERQRGPNIEYGPGAKFPDARRPSERARPSGAAETALVLFPDDASESS